MSKPKLLIHSLIFPPDQVSTAYLYGDLAKGLVDSGWSIEVFTTTPHYNYKGDFKARSKRKFLHYETDYFGSKVIHISQQKSKSTIVRGLYLFWFHLAFIIRALFGPSYDIILSPSPPPTTGFLNGIAAKLRGAKAVYNVQEIYPDIIHKTDIKLPKIAWNVLKWMEKQTYKWNSKIVTIDRQFADIIGPRLKAEQLEVIPNFVDTELYSPREFKANPKLDFLGKFLVVYLGNLGKVQDWSSILNCAKLLEKNQDIHFLLVGGGSEYDYLLSKSKTLSNLEIWPYQQREEVPQIIARSNLHIISMNKASDYDGLPSKLLTILSSERPVLVSSSIDTPLSRVVGESGNGLRVDRGDHEAMATTILEIANGERSNELNAKRGRQYILDYYSKSIVIKKYDSLLKALLH